MNKQEKGREITGIWLDEADQVKIPELESKEETRKKVEEYVKNLDPNNSKYEGRE